MFFKNFLLAAVFVAACLAGCSSAMDMPDERDAGITGIPYDSLVKGRKLYIGKCAGCHNLYAPGSFSRDQWSVIMPKMQGPAKITGSEAKTILNYLNSKALNK